MGEPLPIRDLGIYVVLSTPLTAMAGFAAASTVVGESRLEGDDGMTTLGWLTVGAPLLVGLVLIVVGLVRPMHVSHQALTVLVGAVAVVSLTLGIAALILTEKGDAPIGGGLLVLTGLALGGIAGYRTRDAWF